MNVEQISTKPDVNPILCTWCGSEALRSSRFRAPDFLAFMMLQFPVRCRNCMMRQFIPLFRAGRFFKRPS